MAGRVEVADYSIWIKHIVGDEGLKRHLSSLAPDAAVELSVDGNIGLWRRMLPAKNTGRPTLGLAPVGPAKSYWGALYASRRGDMVDIAIVKKGGDAVATSAPAVTRWEEAPEAEREAAWEAFKALRAAGWRSEKPYGPREELYDRDDR